MSSIPLSSLRPGMDCRLEEMHVYGNNRRRLQDLGFLHGTKIFCAYVAPTGSPIAVICRGTLLALRKELCDRIMVSAYEH